MGSRFELNVGALSGASPLRYPCDEFVELVCGPFLGEHSVVSAATSKRELVKHSPQWVDARALDLCRLVAKRIRRRPELFAPAVETLAYWKKIQRPHPGWLKEWERIFKRHSCKEFIVFGSQLLFGYVGNPTKELPELSRRKQ
jgi:hypothetical protein